MNDSEWMLCEVCHYSWLRDPSRPVPLWCPECGATPIIVKIGGEVKPDES